mmetsp:Transcript_55072/g.75267  ORF Transcript_55072/g.75267 Transcript_55072/m.75267 type:complete len:96 (-) Transcript_55072:103-390(-)
MDPEAQIGQSVARMFGGQVHHGVVTKYLPPVENDDCDLWEILYEDGDHEELDSRELREAMDRNTKKATPPKQKPSTGKRNPPASVESIHQLSYLG